MRSLSLLFVLVGCASTGGVTQEEPLLIRVSPARVAECKANGGCGLYSRAELMELIREAMEAGTRANCPAKNKVLL